MRCERCESFFSRFSCSAKTHGECDCPKCQGYCKCDNYPIQSNGRMSVDPVTGNVSIGAPDDTAPQPQRGWVGLTETDLANCDTDEYETARRWERLLREKNGGRA